MAINCIICGNTSFQSSMKVVDHSMTAEVFTVGYCDSCNFLMTLDPPSEDAIGPYYTRGNYISHQHNDTGLMIKIYRYVRSLMLSWKYKKIKSNNQGKTVLDIGCGNGDFLHYMKQKSYQVMGIEKSDSARNYAQSHFELDVKSPDFLLENKLNKQFDIISLWHVLEHIYQPSTYITQINNLLANGGILCIAVPNAASFDFSYYKTNWAALDVPRHLWHFTPDHIKKLMAHHGFILHKLYALPFDSFYISMMSEKYKGGILSWFKGVLIGKISFLQSFFNPQKGSSVLYIFKKQSHVNNN